MWHQQTHANQLHHRIIQKIVALANQWPFLSQSRLQANQQEAKILKYFSKQQSTPQEISLKQKLHRIITNFK